MGRKKTSASIKRAFLPFCYYCEREFESEDTLIQHQRFKHFKCPLCNRKPESAGGLVVHMLQVHKESLSRVPNAMIERDNPENRIVGMQGVPTASILARARGTDLEEYITRGEVHKHPLFAAIVASNTARAEEGKPDIVEVGKTLAVDNKSIFQNIILPSLQESKSFTEFSEY